MKVTKLILLLSLLPFILTTCKDDEPQYLGEFRLGAEGEAYIKFEPGSYWVYENDMTGERDSFEMRDYNAKVETYEGFEYSFQKENVEFSWYKNQTSVYYFEPFGVFADATRRPGLNPSTDMYTFTHYTPGFSGSCIFYYPFSSEYTGSVSGQQTIVSSIYDSLQVQGEWYYDVAVFEVDNDPLLDNKPSKYYWAKNVGLIKKEKFKHWTNEYIEGWHLVKYQVTQ